MAPVNPFAVYHITSSATSIARNRRRDEFRRVHTGPNATSLGIELIYFPRTYRRAGGLAVRLETRSNLSPAVKQKRFRTARRRAEDPGKGGAS